MTALIKQDSIIQRLGNIQDNYTFQIRDFIRWLLNTGNSFDENGIRQYFEYLNTTNYTASTIRNKRQAVKKRVRQIFYDAPIAERVQIDRVLKDLDAGAPKINSPAVDEDRTLSPVEYRELLSRCKSQRQKLFLRFLWDTGCRVSEMIGVRLDRCEILENIVKIRILGKGNKERFVKIRLDLFNSCREIFNGNEFLFETSSGSKYCRDYVSHQITKQGLKIKRHISAHSLRHSWASRKVQALPGKLDAVSRYLGHSSVSITLGMYCHSQLTDGELFADDMF